MKINKNVDIKVTPAWCAAIAFAAYPVLLFLLAMTCSSAILMLLLLWPIPPVVAYHIIKEMKNEAQ
jgi:hypothetical protein